MRRVSALFVLMLVTIGSLLTVCRAVPAVAGQRDTWKLLKKFPTTIGCGYFFDKDHGLIGSGVRPGTYLDTNWNLRVWPGTPVSIYRTSDGGASWQDCITPAGINGAVTNISMEDDSVGYASIFSTLEYDYNGTFGHSAIWKTTDGGATWINFQNLDNLATSVYAQHDLLLYTKWDIYYCLQYPLSYYLRSLDTFGGRYSYDEGQSWTKNFRRANGVDFSDSLNGVVTEMNGDLSNFWYTKDAGRTWLPSSGLYEAWSVYALKSRNIYFTSNESQNNLIHDTVYWSVDSGATWRARAGFPGLHFTGSIAGKGSTLYLQTDSTFYYNTSLVYYGMYRSDDTGATWHWVGGPSNSRDTRFVVTGCSGEIVYAFDGKGGIWKTIDGGDGTMDGGNPNDAQFVLREDSIAVAPNPCSDTLSIVGYSASCVPVTVDSVVQIEGTDLIPLSSGLPLRLGESDSLQIPIVYSPLTANSSKSKLRVYSHAGYRSIVRDVDLTLTNTANSGIQLSKTASNLATIGCGSVLDTIYLSSVGCPGMILDSALLPQSSEVTLLLRSFPDTISNLRTFPIILGFSPDSAGQHDYTLKLYAHLNRQTFDTTITISATSIRAPLYFVLDSSSLNFRTTYCQNATQFLHLSSSSCDSVMVDSIVSSRAAFLAQDTSIAFAPRITDSVSVQYIPDTIGTETGNIHVYAHSRLRSFDTVISLTGTNNAEARSLTLNKDQSRIQTTACQLGTDSLILSNQGCGLLMIDSVVASGTEIIATFDTNRRTLASNDSLALRILFAPDSGNSRTVLLHVYLHTINPSIGIVASLDTVIQIVATNQIATNPIVLSTNAVSLLTKYCQPVDTVLLLGNLGCSAMIVDSAVILGDTRGEFSIVGLTDTLLSQSDSAFGIRFTPDTSGTRAVLVKLYFNTGESLYDTTFSVSGTNITSPEPYLPYIDSANAGSIKTIPVMLQQTTDPFSIGSYSMHLRFDTNILTPDSLTFLGTVSGTPISSSLLPTADGASIQVTLRSPITEASDLSLPLVKLVTSVSLTAALNTSIELDTFSTDVEPTLELCSIPLTYFRTALECGDPTLVSLLRGQHVSVDIVSLTPNPVGANQDWELSYTVRSNNHPQKLAVEIYNSRGESQYQSELSNRSIGTHRMQLVVPETSGDYFLVLRSENAIEDLRKFSVLK